MYTALYLAAPGAVYLWHVTGGVTVSSYITVLLDSFALLYSILYRSTGSGFKAAETRAQLPLICSCYTYSASYVIYMFLFLSCSVLNESRSV